MSVVIESLERPTRLKRPTLSVDSLLVVGLALVALGANLPFWHAALAPRDLGQPSTWRFALLLPVMLVALHVLLFAPFATRRTVRPLLSFAVIASTLAGYFIHAYGVVLDPTMLRNVLATDAREAGELLTPGFAAALAVGVALAALPWLVRVEPQPWQRALLTRSVTLGVALLAGTGALLLAFQDLGSLMRNDRSLRYLITPANVVWSLGAALAGDAHSAAAAPDPAEPVTRALAVNGSTKPVLFVMVVGETARAANFSLNGYARQTNPELEKLDVVYFKDVAACGTSTEVSLPCMFSPYGRTEYDEQRIRRHESLLHLLARAGVDVVWLDNQSGCKGVCRGLDTRDLSHEKLPALCSEDRCLDEVMLHGLADVAAHAQRDTVVVMHQLGNHGPAYFRRYPADLRRFVPACESQDLRSCSREEIVNAYDNAILYTDRFLARTISALGALESRFEVALVYVSDHGESLGENGLYLHGVPYLIAPREQKEVPMLWWFGDGAAHALDVDLACLQRRAQAPASHDNLFHSTLGLLSLSAASYKPARDLFRGCRTSTVVSLPQQARN